MADQDLGRTADDQILWMVRAGMVDAEIAARLNIPTADVKRRVELLASRYGVEGREDLRTSRLSAPDAVRDREGPQRFGTLARYAAVGAVCAVLGAAAATAFDSSAPGATPTAATVGLATVQPTATPETVTIDEREWQAGRFSVPFAGFRPVMDTSHREQFTVVTLQRDSVVQPAEGWSVTPGNGGGFGGSVGGIPLTLAFLPWGSSGLVVAEDEIVAYSRDGSPPQIIVTAAERLSGRNHPVLVQPDGSIFIDPRPSRDDVPIDYNTGEALDLSSAMLIGNLGPAGRGAATNWCIDKPPCGATLFSAGVVEVLAPAGGTVTCPDGDFSPETVMTFESGPFRLHFRRIVMGVNGIAAGELRCLTHGAVRNSAPILDTGLRYEVSATDLRGSPISVVIDRSGNVWTGEIKPKFGCPCRSGN